MKRIFLSSFVFLAMCLCASAQISEQEALNRAGEFLNAHPQQMNDQQHSSGRRGIVTKTQRMSAKKLNDGLYVVSSDDGGFVIVANSDNTEQVLGYSYDAPFDEESMPENVKTWMTNVGRLVKRANAEGPSKSPKQKATVTVKSTISPMTQTEWNQGSTSVAEGNAYNRDCPTYNSRHCLTGCVATAMAQVMYYHQWPKTATTAVPAYTSNNSIGTLDELPAVSFDWDNMLDVYEGSDLSEVNSDASKAVGTLMRYCGQGAKMNYGTGGSSATSENALNALVSYFGYNPNAYVAYRSSYSNTDWENLIYNELTEKRPVLYSGQSTGGGHAFVCDGYDGEGHYHINWGWGGLYNGYFSLSVLNSESNDGAGASSTEDGYSFMQDALIGVQAEETAATVTPDGLTVSNMSDNGSSLTMQLHNKTSETIGTIYFSFGVINYEGNVTTIISITAGSGLPCGSYYPMSVNHTDLASKLSDGIYVVTGIQCSEATSDVSKWTPANGYEKNYAVVTISGGSVTDVVTHPLVCDITVSGAEFTGTGYTGEAQEVKASFKNNTNEEYNGTVVMVADNSTDFTNYTYKSVVDALPSSIAGLYTYANGPGTAYYYFIPSNDGTHTLYFWEIKGTVCNRLLGTATVTSIPSSMEGEFKTTMDVDNLFQADGVNYLISDVLTAKVTFNNSTTSSVSGTYYYIMKGDSKANGFSTTIGPNSSFSRTISMEGLTTGQTYTFILTKGSPFIDNPEILASLTFTVGEGALCYDADCNISFLSSVSAMTIPASAVAVDFSKANISASSEVTPNSNPNCIYFFKSSQTVPSSLTGKNIVKGNTAEEINLQQGYPFLPIRDFTADAVSFTAQFSGSKEDSKDGWSTLVIPFEANQVSCNEAPISWFTSANDTGKNFWLYQFTYEENGKAHFDYVTANVIKANIPYIIAVPDDSYGDEWSLDSKDIVFSADITEFKADSKCSITGQQLRMKGTYQPTRITNGYVLNEQGNAFVRVSSDGENVDPFSAYFENLGNVVSSSSVVNIVIGGGDGQATGIRTPMYHISVDDSQSDGNAWYNLQGQRVSQPTHGIYIHGGKKVLIK